MIAVVIPGLIISLLGMYFVSQQKRARELNAARELTDRMNFVRDRIENQTLQCIKTVFQTLSNSKKNIDYSDANNVMTHIKRLVLAHPIVKHPFFINSQKQYLFPFSKKTSFPAPTPPYDYKKMFDRSSENNYIKGENLEFKERKYVQAVRYYLKYLEENPDKKTLLAYVYHAIGRCYFRMGKYPQALHYYRRVLDQFPIQLEKDKSLHFLVLRQIALSYTFRGSKREALNSYLDLYEKVLGYELSKKSNPFEFFKNEALAYLNRHVQQYAAEKERFSRARQRDRLSNASQLDISLGWLYFEGEETGNRQLAIEESERETSRFLKLQELYTAADEKTVFYKTLRNLDEWSWTAPEFAETPALKIKQVILPQSNFPIEVCIKKILRDHPTYNDIFFGFMISFEFIRDVIIPEAAKENLDEAYLTLSLADPAQAADNKYKLLSVPLREISPGKHLVLHSNRENYIQWVVEKEARLLYGLMLALLIALFLGFFILFKYITREAELVRLKALFVDSVSHTLKTPLTRMALMAENVQQGWVTEENQKQAFFHSIIRETTLMNEMINNMLDFSRIEAGKKEYHFQACSLQEIVRTVVEGHSNYITEKGFELNVEIDDRLPPLELDREAIALLTANLIQNALKYSDKEKYIGIRVYRENHYSVLEVEDRGIGIAEKDLANIFKKFYRVSDPMVRACEGSGLGLFIARHAAAAHNGEIQVKSQVGKGSIFRVILKNKETSFK